MLWSGDFVQSPLKIFLKIYIALHKSFIYSGNMKEIISDAVKVWTTLKAKKHYIQNLDNSESSWTIEITSSWTNYVLD